METTDRQRLAEFIRYLGITTKSFEERCRLYNGFVNSKKTKSISGKNLENILGEFPNLNRIWLLTGEGEMLTNDVHQVPIEPATEPYTTNSHGVRYMKREDGKLIIQVPIVPYYALASPDDEFLPERFGADTTTFEVDKIGRGKYYAFEVDGDSMDDGTRDSFQRGDIVLVRELDKDDWMPHLHISCWRFWVVCWGNNVRLKEIIGQEGAVITLHSLNPSPEYCDFSLDLSQVSRLFNVIKHKPKERSFI